MDQKKIVIFNISGNVGKTTIAKIIADTFPDMKTISLESLNEGVIGEAMRSDDDFNRLQDELVFNDELLVDVGASNSEAFLTKLKEFSGTIQDIDTFIIPVVPAEKSQIDTIRTIKELAALGVDSNNIRLVFNNVHPRKTAEQEFPAIFAAHKEYGGFTLPDDFWVPTTELFSYLKAAGLTLGQSLEISQDEIKAKMKSETDLLEKDKLKNTLYAARSATPLAATMDKLLDYTFG